ncbi:arginase family protein [Sporolactobacillus kofuensis]|uniref:Arginase family protein n=1 Tax=Sporolactobacillus kofuensis TaxID=269672 RepID=A0ABW1WCQ3_9BACL|nr:arginase family protein [Sporolactobacillus kofuensis]MCO7175325.1 arginase family protein [Sporolactobacillus kofuensis]
MTLLHHDITFCNFDGTYEMQDELLAMVPHHWIDFRNLRGTHLYCSAEAYSTIAHQLNACAHRGLTFLGSGNYHYVTLALMKQITEPFTLILFDHHTDLKEGRIGTLLSCGSWVRHALSEVPNLQKVIILGPNSANTQISIPKRNQVTLLPEHNFPSEQRLSAFIPTDTVYVSIDKDLLSTQNAETNWDQGHLRLAKLLEFLDILLTNKKVEGMDVCGEWPTQPHQHLDPQTLVRIKKNEWCNRCIAQTFLNHRKDDQLKNEHSTEYTRHKITT